MYLTCLFRGDGTQRITASFISKVTFVSNIYCVGYLFVLPTLWSSISSCDIYFAYTSKKSMQNFALCTFCFKLRRRPTWLVNFVTK